MARERRDSRWSRSRRCSCIPTRTSRRRTTARCWYSRGRRGPLHHPLRRRGRPRPYPSNKRGGGRWAVGSRPRGAGRRSSPTGRFRPTAAKRTKRSGAAVARPGRAMIHAVNPRDQLPRVRRAVRRQLAARQPAGGSDRRRGARPPEGTPGERSPERWRGLAAEPLSTNGNPCGLPCGPRPDRGYWGPA